MFSTSGLFHFFPGVFSTCMSRVTTGACAVTTDLIMRVDARTSTTTTPFSAAININKSYGLPHFVHSKTAPFCQQAPPPPPSCSKVLNRGEMKMIPKHHLGNCAHKNPAIGTGQSACYLCRHGGGCVPTDLRYSFCLLPVTG